MRKKTNVGILLLVGAAFSFLSLGYANGFNFAVAQTTETPDPGAETIQEFEKLEGNDTAILENDTTISNPNNTLLDAIEVNEEEDCMVLADGSKYCP
ncbi:MAG TPA: hypothetical protein VF084_06440 [Nitrososphaeraceae archaeon]